MFTMTEIRARADIKPFSPFRVVVSSGQAYEVRHPELIWVTRREVIIARPIASDDPRYLEGADRISMLHVTALEDLDQPLPPSANGQAQGKSSPQ